ncbi:hypothetical protein ACQJBY_041803 [Aegilops geniculata]
MARVRGRVETPRVPMWPSAQACFDCIMATKAAPASSTHRARIRFFDDHGYSRYIREQLENKEEEGSGRKVFRPTYVAVGPRFHREDDLQQGQEFKRMAACDFWEYSDQPFTALFQRVEAVADLARGSYSSTATAGLTHHDFTAMMFVDGCFLLQLIVFCASPGSGGAIPVGSDDRDYKFGSALGMMDISTLLGDVFMVENQIPWVVLRELMSLRPVQVTHFVDAVVATTFDVQSAARPADDHRSADYQPIHLLDLLCRRQIGGQASGFTMDELSTNAQMEAVTLTSATELAEAGVCICPSRTPRFADVGFSSPAWSVFGQLSLPPLVLRHTTIDLLLNMLAFELLYPDNYDTRSYVAGYFGMLSALMSREEDVRQLRRKGIIQTTLGDMEVIRLLRKLEPHTNGLKAEFTTYLVRPKINDFFKRLGIWIEFHRFVYKNLKFLIAIASFLSVSLSILKAILALQGGSSK